MLWFVLVRKQEGLYCLFFDQFSFLLCRELFEEMKDVDPSIKLFLIGGAEEANELDAKVSEL